MLISVRNIDQSLHSILVDVLHSHARFVARRATLKMVNVSNCFHLNGFNLVVDRQRLGHLARHTTSTLPFGICRVSKRLEIFWKDFERHSYVSCQHVDGSIDRPVMFMSCGFKWELFCSQIFSLFQENQKGNSRASPLLPISVQTQVKPVCKCSLRHVFYPTSTVVAKTFGSCVVQ